MSRYVLFKDYNYQQRRSFFRALSKRTQEFIYCTYRFFDIEYKLVNESIKKSLNSKLKWEDFENIKQIAVINLFPIETITKIKEHVNCDDLAEYAEYQNSYFDDSVSTINPDDGMVLSDFDTSDVDPRYGIVDANEVAQDHVEIFTNEIVEVSEEGENGDNDIVQITKKQFYTPLPPDNKKIKTYKVARIASILVNQRNGHKTYKVEWKGYNSFSYIREGEFRSKDNCELLKGVAEKRIEFIRKFKAIFVFLKNCQKNKTDLVKPDPYFLAIYNSYLDSLEVK